ncbi:hypothetical protein [Gilliamella sp. Pas-s27]|uniref:glycoside hydrolase family 19 protein n=1 Tax=Gilliamella sp. Pas-s27 TaxID=2687311 RepID=UPI001922B7F1|nr:hypothetical protein [Gilliamella sp. Pas-s27]
MASLVNMNDAKLSLRDNRAIDAQNNVWLKIDVLDDKNRKRSGWVLVNGEGAKRVCCWDWFDFTQIKETATLKDIYLDADKSLKRNKDNHSLSGYKPTIKETLSILDKQYLVEEHKYTSIKEASFQGIVNKPILYSALSRLLINYKSEWYSKVDAEGKLREWEELNSEMTEDAKNLLGYLQTGDEAKFEAYLSSVGKAKDSPEAKGFETLRREISRFPADYKESPSKKLTKAQFESYAKMEALEKQVTAWEKTKEKIKKMLWWEDVAKGLARLNQQNDTQPENGEATNATTATTTATDTTPPATLSADGKAWFIHPVALFNLFRKSFKHVSYEQLSTIMSGCNSEIIETFLPFINDTMEIFDIKSPLRKAHFLAQIAHETGQLRYMEEIASGKAYEGNISLGNILEGDGIKFKGRGLLQLTGRNNYTACQTYLRTIKKYHNLDITSSLENAKKVASNPELASLASGYYWLKIKPKLNIKADEDDLYWVSVYVNGWKKQDNPYYL